MRTVGLIVPIAKREQAKCLFRDIAGEAEYLGFEITLTKDGKEYTAYNAPYPDDLIAQFEAEANGDPAYFGEWVFDGDMQSLISGYEVKI